MAARSRCIGRWGPACSSRRTGYRIDLLVDDAVIVELKSVDQLAPVHEAQLLMYMKLARIRTGLLINFNQQRLVDGLRRFKL